MAKKIPKMERLSAKEGKAREQEINRKKNKKRDFRKWAKKHLKPGAWIEPSTGIGEGKFCYCFGCNNQANNSTGKSGDTGIEYYCNKCGSMCLTMYKSVFRWFMTLDEQQQKEFRDLRVQEEGTNNLSYTLPEVTDADV